MNKSGQIGIIFHWGIYSVPAYDSMDSLRKRKVGNGSEWYYRRLTESGDFRPISGYKETQEYHKKNYGDLDYYDFAQIFNKSISQAKFNWDDLFTQLVNKNISYIILTTKHHDGFCLWDTKTTEHKSSRNLVGEFVNVARKYKLKVGFYYSWLEFSSSITKNFISSVINPQIEELEKYKPDYWWFDGDWAIKTQIAKTCIGKIVQSLRTKSLINSRVGLAPYDIRIFGDRTLPDRLPDENWEFIFTIGESWGYNRMQESIDYMSGKAMHKIYKYTMGLNGNFLINFGPKPDGTLDPNELKSYNEFIKLI